jgi:hypothetical protein
MIEKLKNYIKNLSSKLIEPIEQHAMLQLFVYVAMASVIVALSIIFGPGIFHILGYNTTDENTIKASDAISYFLQTFLAVVIAFLIAKSTENKEVNQPQPQNKINIKKK